MKLFSKSLFFLFSFALLLTIPVHAEQVDKNVKQWLDEETNQTEEQSNETSDTPSREQNDLKTISESPKISAWDFIKMIFATIFVIFLIYFVLKLITKRGKLFSQQRFMENLGGTSLGTNRSIQLVKVGNQILVVGVGESITLLKEIHNEDEVTSIVNEYNSQLDQMVQPMNLLKKFSKNQTISETGHDQFSKLLKDQLSELSNGRKKIMQQLEKKGSKS